MQCDEELAIRHDESTFASTLETKVGNQITRFGSHKRFSRY
jgi:hypothetical protein